MYAQYPGTHTTRTPHARTRIQARTHARIPTHAHPRPRTHRASAASSRSSRPPPRPPSPRRQSRPPCRRGAPLPGGPRGAPRGRGPPLPGDRPARPGRSRSTPHRRLRLHQGGQRRLEGECCELQFCAVQHGKVWGPTHNGLVRFTCASWPSWPKDVADFAHFAPSPTQATPPLPQPSSPPHPSLTLSPVVVGPGGVDPPPWSLPPPPIPASPRPGLRRVPLPGFLHRACNGTRTLVSADTRLGHLL